MTATAEHPHTAIPTWSGFVYQGKVALYHILQLFCESEVADLADYAVQLDSIEDFSIIDTSAGGSPVVISMHQVKSVNSSYYSTYKDDFEKLEQKKVDFGNTTATAYFHLAVKNERSAAKIQTDHPTLEIYLYGKEEFCPLNVIDGKIAVWISAFLKENDLAGHDNNAHLGYLADMLEGTISKAVLAVHNENHGGIPANEAAYNKLIPLDAFRQILVTDPAAAVMDERYFELQIKNSFNRYYLDFCNDPDNGITTKALRDKLERYMLLITSYTDKDFHSFLQRVQPHRVVKYATLQNVLDCTIQSEAFKDAFLTILTSIRDCDDPKRLLWQCPDSKFYQPTSIPASNEAVDQKRTCEKIVKTILDKDVKAAFDGDILVSRQCNAGNILSAANRIYQAPDYKEKVHTMRPIQLIDLDTAKRILNA